MTNNECRSCLDNHFSTIERIQSPNLSINCLWPTQSGLRDPDQMQQMIDYVRNGGFFDPESLLCHGKSDTLISIRCFEDGNLFLHDGHHRTAAVWLGGRDFLRHDEFELTTWAYEQYTTPNLEAGFLTPFHPKLEVRVAELSDFKKEAREIAKRSAEEAMNFIRNNKDRYCQPRTCWHISEITF